MQLIDDPRTLQVYFNNTTELGAGYEHCEVCLCIPSSQELALLLEMLPPTVRNICVREEGCIIPRSYKCFEGVWHVYCATADEIGYWEELK